MRALRSMRFISSTGIIVEKKRNGIGRRKKILRDKKNWTSVGCGRKEAEKYPKNKARRRRYGKQQV